MCTAPPKPTAATATLMHQHPGAGPGERSCPGEGKVSSWVVGIREGFLRSGQQSRARVTPGEEQGQACQAEGTARAKPGRSETRT